jgi:hypothetical protein
MKYWLLNHDHVYFTLAALTLHENAISCQVENPPDVGPSYCNMTNVFQSLLLDLNTTVLPSTTEVTVSRRQHHW